MPEAEHAAPVILQASTGQRCRPPLSPARNPSYALHPNSFPQLLSQGLQIK